MLYLPPPCRTCLGTFSYDIDTNTWTWSSELYQRRGLDPTEAEPTWTPCWSVSSRRTGPG